MQTKNFQDNDYFACAIHELRTPLTAIQGYSELVAKDDLPGDKVKEFSQIVHRNSCYVLRLINSLLDLSKLQAGKFGLEQKSFNLFALCEEVDEVSKLRAEEKGISFGIEYSYPLPTNITGDFLRLKQVLLNLTSNAVKFTREGGVKLIVSFLESSSSLMFQVVDTGIGFNPEEQQVLFAPFTQATPVISKEFGGTGLGLLVSKEILKQMGATLEVSSEPGRGSAFSVLLPLIDDQLDLALTNPRKKERLAKGGVPLLEGRVLVVEDVADVRNLVKFLLEKTGVKVVTSENGQIGLETALRQDFDLILLDRNLPLIEGPEVCMRLRESGVTSPILAFSADPSGKRAAWIREAGLSGSIPKPFTHAGFYRTVKKHLKLVSNILESTEPLRSEFLDQGDEYLALISNFVQGLSNRLKRIQDALNSGDYGQVDTEAHNLCSSRLFGFPLLERAARNLQKAARDCTHQDILLRFTEMERIIQRIQDGQGN